jgi:hypothetical protein
MDMAEAKDNVTKISCVLALLLFAGVAVAQNTQAPVATTAATEARVAAPEAPAQTAPATSTSETHPTLNISFAGGQLRIDALDSTLGDVLVKVAALTGVKIEIPAGAGSERLRVVKLGPGSARQILASLLYGSNFDYLILASAADPEGIQNVVLKPREKKGSGASAGGPSRSPYATPIVPRSRSDEQPEPNSPVPAQPENTTAQASPAVPAPTQPELPTPSQSVLSPAALSNRSGLTSEGALSPPSSMDQQSINQQLQQMYQQRMQITQQQRQSASPSVPAKPASQ